MNLEDYKKELQSEIKSGLQSVKSKIPTIKIHYKEFLELVNLVGRLEMIERGDKNSIKEFTLLEHDLKLVEYLYNFFTKNASFAGDLNKDIFIAGTIGIGKTLIVSSVVKIVNKLSQKQITRYNARHLHTVKEDISRKPLFIDDLGKENKTVNNFGTKESPVVDLIFDRYDTGAFSIITSNFSFDTLSKFYGDTIVSRIKENSNIFEFVGASRR
jgi:Cdc6-like AAA superfamily ATPase